MPKFKLLTPGNPKTAKGEGKGFLTFILHLAPAKLSGWNVCPKATEGCAAACLNTAGRGGMAKGISRLTVEHIQAGRMNDIQACRIRRTKRYFTERESFMADLAKDIHKACKMAAKEGLTPVFRLNGTSDIRWEAVRFGAEKRTIFEHFPHLQFYDYTKLLNRKQIPANYHLTFSLADGNRFDALQALAKGMSVAVVFRNKETVARYIERGFIGHQVVNGDETDLRFLDPKGVWIGLYAKGNAKKDKSGFVIDYNEDLRQ